MSLQLVTCKRCYKERIEHAKGLCQSCYNTLWRQRHPEFAQECLSATRRWAKNNKRKVINHYSKGTNRCMCCHETIFEFLTLDHILGGGNSHRKSMKNTSSTCLYHWLIKNNYPEGFQILCFNCNHAKHIYGICPHNK